MTELEKLRAGLEYDFYDAEVDGLKLHALKGCQKLNAISLFSTAITAKIFTSAIIFWQITTSQF